MLECVLIYDELGDHFIFTPFMSLTLLLAWRGTVQTQYNTDTTVLGDWSSVQATLVASSSAVAKDADSRISHQSRPPSPSPSLQPSPQPSSKTQSTLTFTLQVLSPLFASL